MTSSFLGTALTRGRLPAVLFSLAVAAVSTQDESPTRVRVNDVELHYIERGQGEPLILLHGGQGDYRAWPLQMEALSPRYRVISYSRRYHYPNQNPLTASNHSALIDAADLAGLIAELRLGPVHLVGTSYGAFTALALAVEHPELVRSLVLAEPPIHRWVTHTARGGTLFKEFLTGVQQPAAKAFAAGNDEAAMRIFIDTFDGVGTFAALPAERRTTVLQNAGFFKAATSSSDPFPNLPKERVRRLRMPILIVRGDGTDELHRLVTEELGRVVPDAERVTIRQAGHGSPRQNPRAFNAAMLDFLGRRGK
jgi:pimeloyl-ACP methyl ester carboxylesterase